MSISLRGEADSSTDGGKKSVSHVCENCGKEYGSASGLKYHIRNHCPSAGVECPTCEAIYSSEYAMKQHHAKTHGESLIREDYTCDWCGDSFQRVASNVEGNEKTFCSVDCKSEWQSEHNTGENNPRYKPSHHFTHECVNCGAEFEVTKSELDRGRDGTGRYCSTDCMDEWRSENWVGENNPLYIDSSVECDWCGGEFQKRPAKIETHDRHYCSRECHGKWLSENNKGEDHPRWKGGKVGYGSNWYEQRRKALERDNHTCQGCLTKSDELDRELSVHHITPRRDFDTPEEANTLDNLVSLCQPCHSKWEGLYLRPDTR